MQIKLLKKGIKVDGKYYPCWYSNNSKNGDVVTIYMKNYDRLPEGLNKEMDVQNDTDIMTDYITKDRIRIPKTSKYFERVKNLAEEGL